MMHAVIIIHVHGMGGMNHKDKDDITIALQTYNVHVYIQCHVFYKAHCNGQEEIIQGNEIGPHT